MDLRTGEIKEFNTEELKKLLENPNEKKYFIPPDGLEPDELEKLKAMTFSQRLDWYNRQKNLGRNIEPFEMLGKPG